MWLMFLLMNVFAKIMAYLPKTDLKDSVKYVDSKSMLYLSELSLLEDAKYYEKVKSKLRAKTLAKIAKTLNVKAVRYDEIQDIIIVKDEILSRSGPTFPVGNPIGLLVCTVVVQSGIKTHHIMICYRKKIVYLYDHQAHLLTSCSLLVVLLFQ